MTEQNLKAAKLCRRIGLFGALALIIGALALGWVLQGRIVYGALAAAFFAAFFHYLGFTFLAKQFEISDEG